MRKKTSTIIGLAIATILTAYVSALTMSNQAFAQSAQDKLAQLQAQGSSVDIAKMFDMQIAANQLAQSSHNTPQQQEPTNALGLGIGHEAQLGAIPLDRTVQNTFGASEHESQLGKVLAGQIGNILGKAGHSLGDVCLSCWGH